MTMMLLKRNIERLKREADRAKQRGDRDAYWEARRAMLLAQAKLRELVG